MQRGVKVPNDNNSKGTKEEIQEIVSAIKSSSIAHELEERLIQLCSCSAAIWNMAGSTDPGYLLGIKTIEDAEQKKRIIEDNLQHVLDFAEKIKEDCWIGYPILEPYLEQATRACKDGDFDKYISILQDMHMRFGKALGICYGAKMGEKEAQYA